MLPTALRCLSALALVVWLLALAAPTPTTPAALPWLALAGVLSLGAVVFLTGEGDRPC